MLLRDKSELNHFLITRFNLRKVDWKKDKNSNQVLDETWLTNRIKLFENYCLPSVLGQSEKNFKWLIFFQNNPDPKVERLIKKIKNYSFIEPILLNGYEDFQSSLPNIIFKRLKISTSWILTSRLDNDDALNSKFIRTLQDQTVNQFHNTILHFPRGLVLDLNNGYRLASINYPMNQFISLLENQSVKEISTVLSQEHDKWDNGYAIKSIYLKNAWLQISHGQNMINSFRGKLAYSAKLKSFKIKEVNFPRAYNLKIFYNHCTQKLKGYLYKLIN